MLVSLYSNPQQELFLRWCELAAFTPVFRTHPGSYPDLNWQVTDY
jgi:alpha-glucosidase